MTEMRTEPGGDAEGAAHVAADRPGDANHDAGLAEKVPRGRLRVDRTLLTVIILLGIGAFVLVRGVLVGITGDDRSDLPPFVESVEPVPEAVQVLNQSNVFVDLATGYTGVLIVDGIELETVNIDELAQVDVEPGQQIEVPNVTIYEAGNATLTFTPSAAAPISQFVDGEHSVEVLYWRFDETRQRARSYTWTFTVV